MGQEKATIRALKFAETADFKSNIICDLEREQKCTLSKLQVLARHFKDEEGEERLNLYYSHSKVNFSLQQFKEASEENSNGYLWNVLAGYNMAAYTGVVEGKKGISYTFF